MENQERGWILGGSPIQPRSIWLDIQRGLLLQREVHERRYAYECNGQGQYLC